MNSYESPINYLANRLLEKRLLFLSFLFANSNGKSTKNWKSNLKSNGRINWKPNGRFKLKANMEIKWKIQLKTKSKIGLPTVWKVKFQMNFFCRPETLEYKNISQKLQKVLGILEISWPKLGLRNGKPAAIR